MSLRYFLFTVQRILTVFLVVGALVSTGTATAEAHELSSTAQPIVNFHLAEASLSDPTAVFSIDTPEVVKKAKLEGLSQLWYRLLNTAFVVAVVLFVLLLVGGGLLWMASAGNEESSERAKRLITAALIGIFLTFAAGGLADFFIYSFTGQHYLFESILSRYGSGNRSDKPGGTLPGPNTASDDDESPISTIMKNPCPPEPPARCRPVHIVIALKNNPFFEVPGYSFEVVQEQVTQTNLNPGPGEVPIDAATTIVVAHRGTTTAEGTYPDGRAKAGAIIQLPEGQTFFVRLTGSTNIPLQYLSVQPYDTNAQQERIYVDESTLPSLPKSVL